MISVKAVKLDTAMLDAMARRIESNTDGALRAIAFQIEAEAKVRAPYKTGALKGGIEVEQQRKLTYLVTDAVEYGIYQELGTKRMKAQPFLVPAVDKVSEYLEKQFEQVFE